MTDNSAPSTDHESGESDRRQGLRIGHFFADTGVESEPLSAYGEVHRFGLDPSDTRFTAATYAVDLSTETPDVDTFDLALFHPPCPRWSTATRDRDADSHPNLIPRARELGRFLADDWIIENVPNAPLNSPVRLNGRMFGLPIDYERAFETTFHVEQPPAYQNLIADGGPFAAHQETGGWQGSAALWRSVKQVSGDYRAEDLKRSGMPSPYIHYLMRWFLRAQ
ncbi:hypothetical protein [Halorarius halobius]|uniref:hypothetical protein n=1 Tax=Halorarius halobius TaxID=2962671 RepID=UPI0020CCB027|nr:hypothetical protein [Halorarius halobius]